MLEQAAVQVLASVVSTVVGAWLSRRLRDRKRRGMLPPARY